MTCEHLVDLVTAYLEGALTEPDRTRFDEHIAECPMCQDHLDRMRTIISELGALHERDIDQAALAELQERFAGWDAPAADASA
jgi:anti-sigma factor RsiW